MPATVPYTAAFIASAARRRQQQDARQREHDDRDAHSGRRVVDPAGRVAEDDEQPEPEDDHDRADHLAPADVLPRQQVAERQREDEVVTSSGWMIDRRPRSSAPAWNR